LKERRKLRPPIVNSPFEVAFEELTVFHDLNAAPWWEHVSEGRIKARYISPFSIILHDNGVYPLIGRGTWIGHFTIIDGSQGLTIGESCDISCGVHIYTHTTHKRCVLGKPKEVKPVKIGNHVFIGPNSVISMGCQIGDHAMIAPLSFLNANTKVPAYAFYAGIPAIKKGDVRH